MSMTKYLPTVVITVAAKKMEFGTSQVVEEVVTLLIARIPLS